MENLAGVTWPRPQGGAGMSYPNGAFYTPVLWWDSRIAFQHRNF